MRTGTGRTGIKLYKGYTIVAAVLVMTTLSTLFSSVVMTTADAGAQSSTQAGTQAYSAVTPFRIADTRSSYHCGNVSPAGSLGPDATVTLTVVGASDCESTSGSVPSNATAVALNVTVTDTTAPGFLTLYPANVTKPTSSNLNWQAGETVPNMVVIKLSPTGTIDIYNGSDGTSDVVVDVEGYFMPASSTTGTGHYQPLPTPQRICDTRPASTTTPNNQCTDHPLQAGTSSQTLTVQVAGKAGLPVTGVSAVALNVTAINPSVFSYLTVYPASATRPTVSNLNFVAGETVPNRVIVGLGTNGSIDVYNFAGTVDVAIDVTGYFTDSTAQQTFGSLFEPISPQRICDTRPASVTGYTDQCTGHTLQAGTSSQTLTVQVAGEGGIPASASATPPTAVVLDVAVTDTTAPSYLTVYPSGATPPTASDLNWTAGVTRANLVVATLAPGGTLLVYNFSGSTDVVIDVVGYFTAAATTWTQVLPAVPISGVSPYNGTGDTSTMYAAMAYDANTNQVIFYGGINSSTDTFAWSGSSWSEVSSANTPPAGLYGASMVYDAANQTILFFGGTSVGYQSSPSNSTWVWDGTNWTEAAPTTSPSGGYGEGMAYDPAIGKVVLYTDYGNTWTWDGTNWTKLSPATSPGPICAEVMAYDPSTTSIILFGGYDNSASVPLSLSGCGGGYGNEEPSLDATWSFDGTTWSKLSPATSPPGRQNAAMAYDPNTSQLVLFGGNAGGTCSSVPCNPLNDTWTFNGNNWTQQSPQSVPPAGDGTNGMVWDGTALMMVGNQGSTWHYPTM
ncbi:MAG: hypothetical protein M1483_04565 [Actinobacteria bacterium]|nr:hypothetical protein [Actinomycetota bacterium]MCL6104885.1 hypothetical protein [Actinomycetota bacterium]